MKLIIFSNSFSFWDSKKTFRAPFFFKKKTIRGGILLILVQSPGVCLTLLLKIERSKIIVSVSKMGVC